MPGSFERDIPKKCQSLPKTSLPLFSLLNGVLNFSKLSYIFTCLHYF